MCQNKVAANVRACCCAGIQCTSSPTFSPMRITKVEVKNKMLNNELSARSKGK